MYLEGRRGRVCSLGTLCRTRNMTRTVRLLRRRPRTRVVTNKDSILMRVHRKHHTKGRLMDVCEVSRVENVSCRRSNTVHVNSLADFSRVAGSPVVRGRVGMLKRTISVINKPRVHGVKAVNKGAYGNIASTSSTSALRT